MTLNVRKILLPLIFTDANKHVAQQAAWLARRFQAEVILVHVVSSFSYPLGLLESGHEITTRDSQADVVLHAQKALDHALQKEFDGIVVTRLLIRGDAAREIVKTARDRNVDLIVMSTHGHGSFYRFILGSVTAKVLYEAPCPIWTGAHLEEPSGSAFTIRNILCSVGMTPHSKHTAQLAAKMAATVDAKLTLFHVTPNVEFFGPGGTYVDFALKEKLVRFAAQEISRLQKDVGSNAEVIIDSGDIAPTLNRAVEQTNADILIVGHFTQRSHLGDNGNGYSMIRASNIPVLSV
jgi:nucleotide-binding universal stress UspA family protein